MAEKKLTKELEKAAERVDKFEESVKAMTHDRVNEAPKLESEPQTKLSSAEIANSKDIYLKPKRRIEDVKPFNEKYRKEYEYAKEYVKFVAENNEIIGESIILWTKPFAGVPAEEWDVPVNKPVWGPRYLAERIKGCTYHRLRMEDRVTGVDGSTQMFGAMVADHTIHRLDAHPASQAKSVFMGASNF